MREDANPPREANRSSVWRAKCLKDRCPYASADRLPKLNACAAASRHALKKREHNVIVTYDVGDGPVLYRVVMYAKKESHDTEPAF